MSSPLFPIRRSPISTSRTPPTASSTTSGTSVPAEDSPPLQPSSPNPPPKANPFPVSCPEFFQLFQPLPGLSTRQPSHGLLYQDQEERMRSPLAGPRETHLAQNPLPMRLPISPRHLNPLKNKSLKPDVYELHIPEQDASPG